MGLRVFNTLSRSVETFVPLDPAGKKVGLYCCGPTVHDFAHIGNFSTFVFADIVRRHLSFRGFNVRHVMNITDVGHMTDDAVADGGGEDKMELAGRRLQEDKKSGKVGWEASGMKSSWNPPALVKAESGRVELVVNTKGKLRAYKVP